MISIGKEEESMKQHPSALAELNFLEERTNAVSTALIEASIRLAFMEQRGPLIAPNLQEAICFVRDLENEFSICHDMVYDFLFLIHWSGPEIPQRKEQWPKWWETVRSSLGT
jgi:hypothetical protein